MPASWSSSGCWGGRLSERDIGQRAVPLAQHDPQPHEVDLPQARRLVAIRCASARARARPHLGLARPELPSAPGCPAGTGSSFSCAPSRPTGRAVSSRCADARGRQLVRARYDRSTPGPRPDLDDRRPRALRNPLHVPAGQPSGSGAASCPILVEDPTGASTFRLKRNVHFADGSPLTAADVVFSLETAGQSEGQPRSPGFRPHGVGGGRVHGRDQSRAPRIPSCSRCSPTRQRGSSTRSSYGRTAVATPETRRRRTRAEGWLDSRASAGAGSGPYELESYDPTSQVVLRANPSYWGAPKPAFGRIVIRNMTCSRRSSSIFAGALIRLRSTSRPPRPRRCKGARGLAVSVQPSPWVFYAFTNDDPRVSRLTSNEQFQRAVRMALDYAGLASVAGPGAVQAPGSSRR